MLSRVASLALAVTLTPPTLALTPHARRATWGGVGAGAGAGVGAGTVRAWWGVGVRGMQGGCECGCGGMGIDGADC